MGTSIQLDIAGVMIDYAKNHMGADHGHLFQEEDLTRRRSDQIDYDYYQQNPDEAELECHEEAFCRPLSKVLPRLNLLGFDLQSARAEYETLVEEDHELRAENEDDATSCMSFDEFCRFACRHPLNTLSHDTNYDATEATYIDRFVDDATFVARLPYVEKSDMFWSEASYFGSTTCILSAYSMLQVFATLEANLAADVEWQFGPIVEAGWVKRDAFTPGAPRHSTILIATEGTSDARILMHALKLRRPNVVDFFRFIDVDLPLRISSRLD